MCQFCRAKAVAGLAGGSGHRMSAPALDAERGGLVTKRTFYFLSGKQLAALRRAADLNQTELARAARIGRNSVSYWENRPSVSRNSYAAKRIFAVLDIAIRTGTATLPNWEARLTGRHAKRAEAAPAQEDPALDIGNLKPTKCGARTRKGQRCRLAPEPGKRRCRAHGGLSTGAQTPEGRARIAEAQRRRWAAWHAEKQAAASLSRGS